MAMNEYRPAASRNLQESIIRIADPPRDIPLSLQLEVLAHRDVTGHLLYLVPAGLLQIFAITHPDPRVGIAAFILSAPLILLVLKSLPFAIYSRLSTLRLMRYGILAAGRIQSCRLGWDRPAAAKPYRDFLGDWTAIVARSQVNKSTGCLARVVILVFVVPFVLMALMLVLIWGATYISDSAGTAEAAGFDGLYIAQWVAGTCIVISMIGLTLYLFRRKVRTATEEMIEGRHMQQQRAEGTLGMQADPLPDRHDAPVVLKEPLPGDGAGVLLSCAVEYQVAGEIRKADAIAPLCERLKLTGEEQLLVDPAHQSRVQLLVNLPVAAKLDAQGAWIPVSGYRPAIMLALTFGLTLVLTVALWQNLQAPFLHLWQNFGAG